MKNFVRILIFLVIGLSPIQMYGWPGMPLPALQVVGRNLQDPCGNNVILHGVAITPSPWFNGCQYGFSSQYCTWTNYDVQGCLDYNYAVMDELTDTSDGWYLNYIRLHIDPYWTNTPGDPISENDISRFSYDRLVTYTDQVIIPMINHARDRDMYVILRPPGVCPERIAVNDAYHNYLKTVWTYLSQHPSLKNADNVMFELANEPIQILGVNGNWGTTGDEHFAALHNFFQPIVDIIRNNGANNICWIPGTGWQSHYQGYVNHKITGGNIGYAVHIYPGYWGGIQNYTAFQSAWDINVKPAADFAPIVVTETDWAPEGYGTFGTATTGTAEGDGFGANLNMILYNSGNASWNVLSPDNLLDHGDPNGGIAYGGDWQACAAPVKWWFQEFGKNGYMLPSGDCGNTTPEPTGCSGITSLPNGTFTLTAKNSDKCIDVYNFSSSDGGNIVQWDCGGGENQQWIVEQSGGYYSFRSVHSDKCLDVADWSTADGANIQQFTCNGEAVQQFCLTDQGNDYYSIINANSGKALDIENISTENGANLQQYSYWGGEGQQFLFTSVGSSSNNGSELVNNGIYELEFSTDANKVLDLKWGEDANGAVLRPWDRNNGTAQQWVAIDAGNGYWRFQSNASSSGRVIDLENGDASNGMSIRLWDNFNNTAQSWQVTSVGNGYYSIKSAVNTAKGFDVPNCTMDGSESLQIWDYYGTSCQLFKFNNVGTKSAQHEMGNLSQTPSIKVYPNPATNSLGLALNGLVADMTSLSIYNSNGSLEKELYVIEGFNQIDISNLISGIYIIKVNFDMEVKTKTFIKK